MKKYENQNSTLLPLQFYFYSTYRNKPPPQHKSVRYGEYSEIHRGFSVLACTPNQFRALNFALALMLADVNP